MKNKEEMDPIIYSLKEKQTVVDKVQMYSGSSDSAIIIDNGSYNCRVGFDTSQVPSLIYRNVLARSRKEKGKDSEINVANDIVSMEALRFSLRSPFDRNVVTQYEYQEILLDYAFTKLGIHGDESRIDHPIVMTHAVANPTICSSYNNELLFELYGVPKVAFGIDGVFSLYHSKRFSNYGSTHLVVSLGYHTIHIIPVLKGKIDYERIKRINVGGSQMVSFLQRSLQLKYPGHINNITFSRSEEMLHDHCFVAHPLFSESLKNWSCQEYYAKNVHCIQLPFVPSIIKQSASDPELVKQRRQELIKNLVEMNARRRDLKNEQDEKLLETLISTRSLADRGFDQKVKQILNRLDMPLSDLDSVIEKVKTRIEKYRQKVNMPKNDPVDVDQPNKRLKMNPEEFDEWLKDIRDKRNELLDKRYSRRQMKIQMTKRRTAASQERMRIITQLAKQNKKEDDFGINDDDWDVYKKISKDAGESDSEEELEKIAEYEKVLKIHDPNFEKTEEDEIIHGTPEWYQIHLATERIRVPEIMFQPSIIGFDQGGISETIDFILKKYEIQDKIDLCNNVYLTGSLAKLPGLKERISRDLIEMMPAGSKVQIACVAENPILDAWMGARDMALCNPDMFMTRFEYQDQGADYIKEHSCSNLNRK